MTNRPLSYRGYRFPPEIISHAVWLYHRFSLSFRDAEDLLAQRGITVTYETIRQWCLTFGPAYARTGAGPHAPRPVPRGPPRDYGGSQSGAAWVGRYFRTGNAAIHFVQIDRYVVDRLRGLLRKRYGGRPGGGVTLPPESSAGSRVREIRTHGLKGVLAVPVAVASAGSASIYPIRIGCSITAMSLNVGDRLADYDVTALIGEGGMSLSCCRVCPTAQLWGEVYSGQGHRAERETA